MEPELGLTLRTLNPMQGFDLNKSWFEPNDEIAGSDGLRQGDPMQTHDYDYKRHKVDEEGLKISLGESTRQKILPFVSWNEEPNEEDDGGLRRNLSCPLVSPLRNLEDEENYVKGWPPIQSWRNKSLPLHRNGNRACRGLNSMYIKVKMEGVAIGRKINLRCYDSYDELFNSLITMFAKYIKNTNESRNVLDYYTLKFQDRDGNWLLAKDVPWRTLVDCVQRIEIRRNIGG